MEITVIDPGMENIAGKIAAGCAPDGTDAMALRIRRAVSPDALNGPPPDLLVLSPDCIAGRSAGSARVRCGILLLPGDADAEGFETGCIVTYGMSAKNSITLSSIGEDACVLALQRELPTVNGDVLERQEIKIESSTRPDSLLAVAGALLILGQKLPGINP